MFVLFQLSVCFFNALCTGLYAFTRWFRSLERSILPRIYLPWSSHCRWWLWFAVYTTISNTDNLYTNELFEWGFSIEMANRSSEATPFKERAYRCKHWEFGQFFLSIIELNAERIRQRPSQKPRRFSVRPCQRGELLRGDTLWPDLALCFGRGRRLFFVHQ